MILSYKRLILFIVSSILSFLLACDAQSFRRYKVCNGVRCQSVRSFVSPEYLFDIDAFTYTSWSRWSPCTRRCSTQRYRACRFPSICGDRMMIYEEAFCFRRGSHCEEIFYRNDPQHYHHQHHQRGQANLDDTDFLEPSWDLSSSSSSSSNERSSTEYVTRRPYADRSEDSMNDTRLVGSVKKSVLLQHDPAPTSATTVQRNLTAGSASSRRFFLSGRSSKSKRHQHHQKNGEDSHCGVARMSGSPQGLMLRILGGQETEKGRWPWQVAILNRMQEAFCGGTLIAPRWILTAAHCVRRRIHVTIGEHHLHRNEGTEKHYKIDAAFIHPDFDPDTVNNDIALLLLPEPVPIQNGVACLPEQRQSLPAPNTLCTILGWGKERHNHVFGTTVLHEGRVPIVNTAECRFTYPYEITNNMFCAGYKGGTVDSCAGDSGGPILCTVNNRWTVFGVTSFGDGCGRRGKYGIYAKVPNYVDWIYKVIQANEVHR